MRIKLALAALALPLATAALAPGAKAPDFTTRGALAGKEFSLKLSDSLKKGAVVLYFFPAANTPGCNAEAKAFAESLDQFKAAGATVIGMSADSVDTLKTFSVEHCAGKFPVASADPAIIKGYDVDLGRQINGRNITSRTSYVIAPDGKILFAHSDMKYAEHISTTLAAVKAWKAKRG